jgi:hypothetical protein
VLDLFLGWTAIGWITTLVWSFTSPSQAKTIVVTQVVYSQLPAQPAQLPAQAPAQLLAPQPSSVPEYKSTLHAVLDLPQKPLSDKLSAQIFKD